MQQDDVLPNDSPYFGLNEPVEQVIERKKKRAQTLEAQPVLKEILSRLNDKVALLGSVDAMPDELRTDEKKFMTAHNGHTIARDILRAEAEYIQGLIDTYGR